MVSTEEAIKEIEEEIKKTKVNKATEHHLGKLKAKLAKLRNEIVKKHSGGSGIGYSIKKSGDATVAMVGFPSVGKSTLINKLTNADSKVGSYDFTTLTPIPGALKHKNILIQIVDLPGIIEGAAKGRGRGKEILSVARNADLILIILEINKIDLLKTIEEELYKVGIRLNQKPPNVILQKKSQGGCDIQFTMKNHILTENEVKGILNEFGIHNCYLILRENVSAEQLTDVIQKNAKYIPSLVVINKSDLINKKNKKKVKKEFITISAKENINVEKLKDKIIEKLGFTRLYLKKPGQEPDFDEPLIIKKEPTIENICNALHKDFIKKFKYARVWGKSAKFPGQQVGPSHVCSNEDIVLIIRSN